MDFDLLSLPPEILAVVFSNIPWDQLINVKLCTRTFKYVTEKYLKDMQKPKLYKIYLGNDYTHNDGISRIRVAYKILMTDAGDLKVISNEKEFFLLHSELDQLRSFLKKVDLTSLDCVHIELHNHTEIMQIFSGYFHNTNRINYFFVHAGNSEKDLGNTLSFLQKVQNVDYLELDLRFPHLNVPKDFFIPVTNSLGSLVIREGENTTFINSRMVDYFVGNNPGLCGYYLSLNNFQTFRMVIGTIARGELSRRINGCLHREISLGIDSSRHELLLEILGYFGSEEFPYIGDIILDEHILFEGSLECPVCGEFDSITIYYSQVI
uniref:F-box domain-containing protein n=1 Tax=Strongyloides papillosus TaxID=174720 RepID=A0A0N5BX27_STREA